MPSFPRTRAEAVFLSRRVAQIRLSFSRLNPNQTTAPAASVAARDPKQTVRILMPIDVAATAAKAAGRTLPKESTNGHNGNGNGNGDWKAQQAEREKKEAERNQKRALMAPIALELFKLVMAKSIRLKPRGE